MEMATAAPKPSTRLNREAWLEAGLRLIEEHGAATLTIDRLTERLGVTKGSFYHHFRNREEFSQALLAHWETKLTREFIEISRAGEDFAERDRRLSRLGEKLFEPELEVAIRAWALRESTAMAFQERVDRQRLDYLHELYRMVTPSDSLARDLATIRYAFYVGAQQIRPSLGPKRYARLLRILQEQMLMLADDNTTDGEES